MHAKKHETGDENSFDALAILKEGTDKVDKHLLFKMNSKHMNPSEPDFVFKSSSVMAKIALQMDIDGPANLLQLENAYFDACHSRVQGFKLLGLWVFHPALKKIMQLATMEIKSESMSNIMKFLSLFNEVLANVSGREGYKFNPRVFLCDEAGSNFKALEEVFGEQFILQQCAIGCQWHFKNNVNSKSKDIPVDIRQKFVDISTTLCHITTAKQYDEVMEELRQLPDKGLLKSWLQWWDVRRSHIFPPFCGAGFPGVNLSEQGNAGWTCGGVK